MPNVTVHTVSGGDGIWGYTDADPNDPEKPHSVDGGPYASEAKAIYAATSSGYYCIAENGKVYWPGLSPEERSKYIEDMRNQHNRSGTPVTNSRIR